VVTYQLLAGRLPYEATSLSELALKQQREAPPPLDVVNPEVPPALARAVARGLALDSAARYASAVAMGEALRAGARGIEPPVAQVPDRATEETVMLAPPEDETEATRMLPPREPATPPRPQPPVRRTPPRRPRERPPERPPTPRRGARSRLGRVLLVLALLAGLGGVAAILAADELSTDPQLRRVVQSDAERAIDEVRDFVEDNTR
jgi:hypothetical protein